MSVVLRTIAGVVGALSLGACVTTGPFLDGSPEGGASRADMAALKRLTDADVNMANAALDNALESRVSGASVRWRNATSGNHGSVTPLATFRSSDGTYCRSYAEEVVVDGRHVRLEDVACRRGRRLWVPLETI